MYEISENLSRLYSQGTNLNRGGYEIYRTPQGRSPSLLDNLPILNIRELHNDRKYPIGEALGGYRMAKQFRGGYDMSERMPSMNSVPQGSASSTLSSPSLNLAGLGGD